MQCAFCGTENRPEYKFCGMCGVKLERRHAERRVQQSGISLKCPSCGHMNDGGLKFCGMCGTRVERRLQERRGPATSEPRAAAVANAQLPTPEGARTAKPLRAAVAAPAVDLPEPGLRRGEPAIFQDESAATRSKNAQLSGSRLSESRISDAQVIDPHIAESRSAHSHGIESQISGPSFLGLGSQSDSSGEYLLEDEPSRGGLRKLLLVVVLIAIIGLLFVQWRSSLKANPKPAPAKAEPAASPGMQGNNQPAPAPGSIDQPAPAKDAANKNDTANSDDSAKTSDKSGATVAANSKAKTEDPVSSVVPSANASVTDIPAASEDKKTPESDNPKPSPAAAKATDDTHLPDHKPSAALIRAQQYLQGRGVPQNCEQGMLYLRAATEKNDPGAAIQMAALYSSGHCVKQDRVMAYRWFNSAHELEPANTWIQRNMDQLWAQMTSQERRLAGY